MSAQPKSLIEAVRSSGLSLREIARRTGLSDGNLSRWMRGELGLSFDNAQKIAESIGYRFELKKLRQSHIDPDVKEK